MEYLDTKERILLAHGSGGKKMQDLLKGLIFKILNLSHNHDATIIDVSKMRNISFTTDSFVINPIFFSGGNIGELAVYGTVNDLAMSGAIPKYLSLSFIIEEGFAMQDLEKILQSIKQACNKVGVEIITGDTKVVERGSADGIYINTTGIGIVEHNLNINPQSIKPGDKIIVSGDVGRHGIAVMAQREGLNFEVDIQSDCAPLSQIVPKLLANQINIHCMRDITRGGLASVLNEFALDANLDILLEHVPIATAVNSACDLLGLDPLHVACEGRMVIVVPENDATKTLEILHSFDDTKNAALIGEVRSMCATKPRVSKISAAGVSRIVNMPSGELLPRIC